MNERREVKFSIVLTMDSNTIRYLSSLAIEDKQQEPTRTLIENRKSPAEYSERSNCTWKRSKLKISR